jgi:hypothetical protein
VSDLLERFDGSGREPRPAQEQVLKDKQDHFDSPLVDCYSLPTGGGKSAIAVSIAKHRRGFIVTPSNPLVDQYISDYPKMNLLQGKQHYRCQYGVSCLDWMNLGEDSCPTCPYMATRNKALAKVPTVFNPMSLYYLLKMVDRKFEVPSIVVNF